MMMMQIHVHIRKLHERVISKTTTGVLYWLRWPSRPIENTRHAKKPDTFIIVLEVLNVVFGKPNVIFEQDANVSI